MSEQVRFLFPGEPLQSKPHRLALHWIPTHRTQVVVAHQQQARIANPVTVGQAGAPEFENDNRHVEFIRRLLCNHV